MFTILSVEDEILNKNLLRRYLKHTDVILLEAENGAEALKLAKNSQPDVILLDYHLPDTNGRELAQELRQIPHLSNVPMISLTADDTGILRKQMLSEGFAEVLYKPVNINVLLDCIESILSGSIRHIA